MSEHTLILVPKNPWFVPEGELREQALDFLKSISPTYEWELNSIRQTPEAQNWYDRMWAKCPICGATLDVNAKHDEWLEESLKALGSGSSKTLTMPCCSNRVPYEDVKFEPEIGYSKCSLGLHEPDYWEVEEAWEETEYGPRLSEDALKKVEEILGCSVHQIWRRQ